METIIASLITAVVSCVGFFCLYNYKLKKMLDQAVELRSEHKELKDENKELKDEHKGLSSEHEKLSAQNLSINDNVKNIHSFIESNAKDAAYRYENLKDNQKDLINKSSDVQNLLLAMRNEILQLQYENKLLRQQLQQQERPPNNNSQSNSNDDELER